MSVLSRFSKEHATGDALKVAKLLVKFRFTEEAWKSIVGSGVNSKEELEKLDDDMCKIFVQNFRKPGSDQKGVVVSMMAQVFLKLLVWRLQHMKCVSRIIVIDAIDIEWCRVMNDHNKLEAAWTNTLSEKDYPRANLGDVPHIF